MTPPYVKVEYVHTNTGRPAVQCAVQTQDGRVFHSERLAVADAPLEVLIKMCIAKAEGRKEAADEAEQELRSLSMKAQ